MDLEKIATASVKTSISITDELSSFINEGDKEPSWDGNIYIYANKDKRKGLCSLSFILVKMDEIQKYIILVCFR